MGHNGAAKTWHHDLGIKKFDLSQAVVKQTFVRINQVLSTYLEKATSEQLLQQTSILSERYFIIR